MAQTAPRPPIVRVVHAYEADKPKFDLTISDVSFENLEHGFVTDYKPCPEGMNDVVVTMEGVPTTSILEFKADHIYTIVVAGGKPIEIPVLNVYEYQFKDPEPGKAYVFLINTDITYPNQLFSLSVRNANSEGHGTFLSEEVFNLENIRAQERVSGWIPTGKPLDVLLQDKSLTTLWIAKNQTIPSDVLVCSLILMGNHSSSANQDQPNEDQDERDGEIHSLIPILKIDIRKNNAAPQPTPGRYYQNTLLGTRKYSENSRNGPSFGSIVTQEELEQQNQDANSGESDSDDEDKHIKVKIQNVLLLQTVYGDSIYKLPKSSIPPNEPSIKQSSEANSGAIQFAQPPPWEPKETMRITQEQQSKYPPILKNDREASMVPPRNIPARGSDMRQKSGIQPIGAKTFDSNPADSRQKAPTSKRFIPNSKKPNLEVLPIQRPQKRKNVPIKKIGTDSSPAIDEDRRTFGEDSGDGPKIHLRGTHPTPKKSHTQQESQWVFGEDSGPGPKIHLREFPNLVSDEMLETQNTAVTKDIKSSPPNIDKVFRVKPSAGKSQEPEPIQQGEHVLESFKNIVPLKGYSGVTLANELGYPVIVKSGSDQHTATFTVDKFVETMLLPGKYRFVGSAESGKPIPAFTINIHAGLNYVVKFRADSDGNPYVPIIISNPQ